MKRLLSLTLALTMLGTAVSCADSGDSSSTVIEAESLSFKEVHIAMGDDFSRLLSLDRSGDKVLIFGESTTGGYQAYITDDNFQEHTTIEFTPKDGEEVRSACIDRLGRVTILTTLDGDTRLYIYGSIGTLSSEENLGEVVPGSDYSAMIYSAYEGYVINYGNLNLSVIDGDLKYIGDVNIGGRTIYGCCKGKDGTPTVLLNDGKKTELAKIDGTSLTDIKKCGNLNSSAFALCAGNTKYELVGNFMDGLYGFDGENWVQITDYLDNSVAAHNIWNILTVNSEYVVVNGQELTLLSERDISEIKEKKVVRIALVGGGSDDMIKDYNTAHPDGDYRAELVRYSFDSYTDPQLQLQLDFLSDNAPDLVISPTFITKPENVFLDLYDFIDNDPDLSRDDFIPNILDSMEINGGLYTLTATFSVRTMAVKSKYEGVKENWTPDELIAACRALPEGTDIVNEQYQHGFAHTWSNMIDFRTFLDTKNGVCHFDSPQFINMLKYIRDEHLGLTEEEFEEYLDANDRVSYYGPPEPDYLRSDRVFLGETYYSSMQDLWCLSEGVFGEDFTFTGLPTLDGVGTYVEPMTDDDTFAIPGYAKEKEGAWDFIKYMLSEDVAKFRYWHRFHVLREYFDMNAEKCLKNEPGNEDYVYIVDGVEPTYTYSLYPDGSDPQLLTPLTPEELEEYKQFVFEACKHFVREEPKVEGILNEELTEYFNTDRSAEETAAMIQNRVSLYMSEQYG